METEKKTCAECGKEFEAVKHRRGGVAPGRNSYCSPACKSRTYYRRHAKSANPILPRDCIACGKNFTPLRFRKQKTCSVSCNQLVQSKRRIEESAALRPGELSCGCCGIAFVPRISSQKFCSRKCYARNGYLVYASKNKERIREKRVEYNRKHSESKKEWVRKNKWGGNWLAAMERDSWTCKKCGCQDRSKLLVHHIDGEGETGASNHAIENLQVVCQKCHREIHRATVTLRINGVLYVKIGDRQFRVIEEQN